jgi:predicted nucleic acid-binding protein
MAFNVIFDANVLYPFHLRDFLIRLARQTEQFRAKWTEEILDEVFGAIERNRPDLDPQRLQVTREKMIQAVPDCLVTGYEDLIPSLELPDLKDRHVLAAAIRCGAQVIVTANNRDFPPTVLKQYKIEILTPDQFVLNLISIESKHVWTVISEMVAPLKSPPLTIDEMLDKLERTGLVTSVKELREGLGQSRSRDADAHANTGEENGYAHYARKGEIARAAVLGGGVTALCGHRFQPVRDPSRFPVCPRCKELIALLDD